MRITVSAEERDLGVRGRTVEVAGRTFRTPRRSLALTTTGRCEAMEGLDPACQGLVELYREITKQGLRDIDGDAEKQKGFANQLFRRANALPSAGEQVILLALAVEDRGYCPRGDDAEYLAYLAGAPFVNLTMIPRVIPLDFDSFLAYVKDFLDAFSTTQGPQLMGYLPNFTRRDIAKLLAFYLKHDIQCFVMEYNGNHAAVLYPNFLMARRTLNREVGDSWYIHGLNVGPGIFRRSALAVPSRDFLGLLSGLDSIGPKHIVRRMPTEVWEKLIQRGGAGGRVFRRRDYGYYEPGKLYRLARERDPGRISLSQLARHPGTHEIRVYNSERQGLEAAVVRKRLEDGTLASYVMGKDHLRGDLEQIKSAQRQRTLIS